MMQKITTNTTIIGLVIITFGFFAWQAEAQTSPDPTFNPHNIISDNEILDSTSMSLSEIRAFINSKAGFTSTFSANTCTESDLDNPTGGYKPCTGPLKSAAEIIYDRSQPRWVNYGSENYYFKGINPKFLIVLLQKEGSLIELQSKPSQTRVDWAVGYGCPDSGGCSARYQGFWRQINSASLQFRDYMDNPHLYNYRPNKTYTVSNTGREPSVVTPQNLATAALYNYTPHVYNGNYNFYTIWQRYFPRLAAMYPNGSLLQADGEAGVWLIQYGKKRPFLSKGALTSRYNTERVVKVSKAELDRYPKGAPIKFPQYSLVQSPKGSIYLINDDYRRLITSNVTFKKLGFNPEEVVNASWDDINSFQEGPSITATTSYPTGALLQDKKTGGVYWVEGGKKSPILDAIIMKMKFKGRKPVPVTAKELAAFPTIAPVLFGDGELLKSSIGTAIYVIADGQKRPINSAKTFEKLGYKWENILTVSPKVLYYYPQGALLTEPAQAITPTPPLVSDQANAANKTLNNI